MRNFIPFRGLRTSDDGGRENEELREATKKDLIILKKTLKYLSDKTAAARKDLEEKIENVKLLKLHYESEMRARKVVGRSEK